MGYWKWLREKAVSRERIKIVLADPYMEFVMGFIAGGLLFGYALGMAIGENCYYSLLFLSLIPCALISLHGRYREEMRRKNR